MAFLCNKLSIFVLPLSIQVDEIKKNIMKSTIRVDFDFDTNETFIQLGLSVPQPANPPLENLLPNIDLADKHLKNFVENANIRGIELYYPEHTEDGRSPQIRLKSKDDFDSKVRVLKDLDEIAKNTFKKEEDYKKWEEIFNLFVTDGVPYE